MRFLREIGEARIQVQGMQGNNKAERGALSQDNTCFNGREGWSWQHNDSLPEMP